MRIYSPLPDSNLGSGGSHLLAYVKPWLSWSDQLMPLMNRRIVTKALDMIEVDVRTTISHFFGKRHGVFGHIDPTNFFVSAPNKQGWFRVTLADALD